MNFFLSRFAFVDFDSADKAAAAHDAMNGETIDGRQVRVDFAAEKGSGGGGDFSPRGRGGRGKYHMYWFTFFCQILLSVLSDIAFSIMILLLSLNLF